MAAIDDLIAQVKDPVLRSRLDAEAKKLREKKKFGLVFEDHVPECTPLYEVPLKKGCKAAKRTGTIDKIYDVVGIHDGMADCVYQKDDKAEEAVTLPCNDLVTVAKFGEPVYPYLQKLDQVVNAPGDPLWHVVMEAENFHALQLLAYLYPHKVDCCYIDAPFNSGARDWKYNNNYVDSKDQYRHSKWLSFMKHRLLVAKGMLNPKRSVLIAAIDEKEYLHLGLLLREIFSDAAIQMVSTVINPKGIAAKQGFRRADEYLYFVMLGDATPLPLQLDGMWSPSAIKAAESTLKKKKEKSIGWTSMMRRGSHSSRSERKGLYYAIYADPKKHQIEKVGDVIPDGLHSDENIENLVQILPIRTNGDEGCWQVGPEELKSRIKQGRVRLGKETSYGFVVNYLPDGEYKKIENGKYRVIGKANDGSLLTAKSDTTVPEKWIAPTQWKISSHDASAYGSTLLNKIVPGHDFSYPKSLYAVRDAIKFFMANKKDALVVDFFAGSGTTLHAVNLLNTEDNGRRRCIIVTNNEVSNDEEQIMREHGLKPGDEEWEAKGIAHYVTWPRTVCSIKGRDINGKILDDVYLDSDRPMSDGFQTNACFYKLGYLDPEAVSYGWQFREMIPMLWLKAGGEGPCPEVEEDDTRDFYVFEENHFAILRDVSGYSELAAAIKSKDIRTIYIVTESLSEYQEDAAGLHRLGVKDTYQLYSDYLKNFSINTKGAEG